MIRISMLFMLTTVLLLGCTRKDENNKNIFRFNETTGLPSTDPAFAKSQSIMWVVHQLYGTLIEVDNQMQLKPSIAKRWEFSGDKKVIRFILRDDVFFHDNKCFPNGKGRRVMASDVVYSFSRILDPAVASPGAWIFNTRVDTLQPFVAVNDTVFELRLRSPFNPVLGILSMQYCSIVPKEAIEYYGKDFRRNPVGTGPFEFVAWVEGQALIMKKFNNYFEKDSNGVRLPYLEGIKMNFYDSKATEFMEFQQGRLDFINDIDPSFKDEILTKTGKLKKQWEGKILLHKHPYLNVEYFGILTDTLNPAIKGSALAKKNIRLAINYAIDRKKMILYMRNSIGIPAHAGFIPAGLPGFDSSKVKGFIYDPEKARQLIAAAGYGPNNPMPVTKLLTIPVYGGLATYVANDLRQVGINVQVEVIQKSLLLEKTSKSLAPFFRASWIADYPDAENYLSVFYGKNPAPPNYTQFKNKRFDQLYEQSLLETNDSLRIALYQEMDKIVIEEAPVVPLWYDMAIHLVQANVKNFDQNSLNMLELRRVKKN